MLQNDGQKRNCVMENTFSQHVFSQKIIIQAHGFNKDIYLVLQL